MVNTKIVWKEWGKVSAAGNTGGNTGGGDSSDCGNTGDNDGNQGENPLG